MGRAPCCEKNGLKKGPWTPEEDQKLLDYIQQHGHGSWRTLPKKAGLARCGKSCRLRWTNYLRPDIKHGGFSSEEEETIIQLHSMLGNKWSAIAARLPGRTDNEIKNYWNTHIRKRLLRMGIDPVTHSPRLDLLDLSTLLTQSICNPAQLHLSRLLGLDPLVNSELLRLANNLLSSQRENSSLLSQNLQENHFSTNPQINNQFQTLDPNNIPMQQEISSCISSNPNFLNEPHFVQSNVDKFLSNQAQAQNFSTQSLQSELYQESGNGLDSCNLDQAFQPMMNFGYYNGDQTFADPSSEKSNFELNSNQSTNFSPVLSTPQSSLTPLHSSSTQVNSYTEDERESYCSNGLMKFEIHELLDASEFL